MTETDGLAVPFEQHRRHLRGVAYRMLGSLSEAEDAVQEAWLRLQRSDTSAVENLKGWLTTVVGRVCLDMLRARKSRREEALEGASETVAQRDRGSDPEEEALLADAVGLALLVVLETLPPAERLAFVLHDLFAVPFEEIAPIVAPLRGRDAAAREPRATARARQGGRAGRRARQPASGRGRVPGGTASRRRRGPARRPGPGSGRPLRSGVTSRGRCGGGARRRETGRAARSRSHAVRGSLGRRWSTARSAWWSRRAGVCSEC